MELPSQLKNLYRHWKFHAKPATEIGLINVIKDKKLSNDISRFVEERMKIWQKKTSGEKPPYTKDIILSQYKFCNIFREFDRQTIEFHEMLNPLRNDFSLWLLNMFYCRMVARTETIKVVGLLSFDKRQNKTLYKRLMDSPRPRFGTPYVFPVSTIQRSETPTRELFIAEYLPSIMKTIAEEIETWNRESVYDGLKKVIPLFKFNLNFLWTEVLIDVAYQFSERIDLFKRFPIGPGSMPTMQRIDANKNDPTLLVEELAALNISAAVTYKGAPLRLSAENWEGIGCEFRKYTNLKAGQGRKRLFVSRDAS